MKKVMVFGVFDNVHEGHRAMLKEAKKQGDYLIVVVTPDEIVKKLKGSLPELNFSERVAHLQKEDQVDEVVAGDRELGSWKIIKKYRPEVLACGYDQAELKKDLLKNLPKLGLHPQIVDLRPFEPNKYKSSLLRKNK